MEFSELLDLLNKAKGPDVPAPTCCGEIEWELGKLFLKRPSKLEGTFYQEDHQGGIIEIGGQVKVQGHYISASYKVPRHLGDVSQTDNINWGWVFDRLVKDVTDAFASIGLRHQLSNIDQ